MPEVKKLSDFLTDNTTRTYYALDEAMLRAHRDDKDDEADQTARVLLEHADLPLLLRARACMVIGCSDEAPDFLEMAEQAVHIPELGYGLCENPTTFEEGLVADCKKVLSEAKEVARQQEANQEDEEELVWQADSTSKGEDQTGAHVRSTQAKKKVGRLSTDSSKTTLSTTSPPRLARRKDRERSNTRVSVSGGDTDMLDDAQEETGGDGNGDGEDESEGGSDKEASALEGENMGDQGGPMIM